MIHYIITEKSPWLPLFRYDETYSKMMKHELFLAIAFYNFNYISFGGTWIRFLCPSSIIYRFFFLVMHRRYVCSSQFSYSEVVFEPLALILYWSLVNLKILEFSFPPCKCICVPLSWLTTSEALDGNHVAMDLMIPTRLTAIVEHAHWNACYCWTNKIIWFSLICII